MPATAAEVWGAVRGFDQAHASEWPGPVACELTKGKPSQVGSIRTITPSDGSKGFRETLLRISDEDRVYEYDISQEDVPCLGGYRGKVQVIPITSDNTCLVCFTKSGMYNPSAGGDFVDFFAAIASQEMGDNLLSWFTFPWGSKKEKSS